MSTKYAFPAVFEAEKEGGYSIYFPDIPGCYSEGETIAECMIMAEDALCLMLYHMEEEKETIPTPTDIKDIKGVKDTDFVSYVSCDTMFYRKYFNNKAVKKTLSIPAWLNTLAEKANINFSATLQRALKAELNIE